MKATAVAPANIAFIKYWGKGDSKTRVPNNNSISMNLSQMYTTTTVEFSQAFTKDTVEFLDEDVVKEKEYARIVRALDQVRRRSNMSLYARVVTRNTFPKATGIASSASGFASFAKAAFEALNISLEEKELSIFCRTLSGTACRSIPSGFVEWEKGTGPDNSYAYQLYPPEYWNICDIIAVVTKTMKKMSSTDGHAIAHTSPFYEARMSGMDAKVKVIKKTMMDKDFSSFGRIIEEDSLNMHAVCLTSTPSILYWEPPTIEIMRCIQAWREEGVVESYFTIDAGPSVHVICKREDAEQVRSLLQKISGILRVEINHPAQGACIVDEHLF